tara:strand:- start:784 stop:1095 length:312 start_codon:yes stop_codon:yes gene_type:complete
MNTSGHKVAINLDDRCLDHPSFKKLPDSIFRHDPDLIKLLVEWMKDNKSSTDMEIIELRGNQYFIDYDYQNNKEILRQPDDPKEWKFSYDPIRWTNITAMKNL